MFFLEEHAGILNRSGLVNLRDVLSHLATMLHKNTPSEKREAQLASAEEHLRRSIFDPYAIALGHLRKEFNPVHTDYRKRIIPLIGKRRRFQKALNTDKIREALREVARLAEEGRVAKGRNLWDPQWEEGVTSLVHAYDRLSNLHTELDHYCNDHRQAARENITLVICIVGTLGTLFFGFVSALFLLKPAALDALRRLLGLAG